MKKFAIAFIVSILIQSIVTAQIDTYSKQLIDDVIVYKDRNKPATFYFAPSKLRLVVDALGKPKFQILKMRYIGTQCSNDESVSYTTNLVQLRIEMPSQPKKVLDEIKLALGKKTKLKPIHITGIESKLLIPMKGIDSVTKSQVISQTNASAAADESGFSTKKSYWTERVFTFSLTNEEMTALEFQIREKTLALSFAYSFYANTTNPLDDVSIEGSKELVDNFNKEEKEEKTLLNRVIESNAFAITVDTDKWPDLIKSIDINESVPPAYAAFELKCFDFYENLRPDLYMKIVEVSARSVDDRKDISMETRFTGKQSEINTKRIHFPYAVLVGKPIKYRVTEWALSGEKTISEWLQIESCSSLLDVTTPADKLTSKNNTCEIEVDESWFIEQNMAIQVKIAYQLNNKPKNHLIVFNQNDLNKEISFYSDKNTELFYEVYVLDNDSLIQKNEKKLLNDTYLYISKQ